MNRFAQPRTQIACPAPAPGSRLPRACWRCSAPSSSPAASRAPAPPPPAERRQETAGRPAAGRAAPNFVVIQTDDQTLDQLYATYTPPGGAPIQAMPNTLALIAGKGITFNRYYVSYPLCCPSRVSLLTGRYAHNHNVRGNVPPNGGYTGFASARPTPTTSPPGCRAPATARSTSASSSTATATNRSTTARPCRPAGAPGTRSSTPTPTTTSTATRSTTTASLDGPFGDSGSWETREYGERDDFGCPFAPLNGQPCLYETDVFTRIADEEMLGTPDDTALLPAARLHRAARRLPPARRAGAGDRATTTPSPAPPTRTAPRKASTRATSTTSRASSAKPPYLSPTDIHTYRVYYQKALESLRVDRRRRQADRRHARRHAPAAQHLHHLHLRQRLLLRRAPAHRRQVPRLRALDPPAVPDARARDQTGQPRPASWRPTSTSPRRSSNWPAPKPTKASTGARSSPTLHDPSLRTRRPILFESFVETNDVEENGGGPPRRRPASRPARPAAAPASTAPRRRARGASASIVAPPKDYEGIRLGPYKYIEWPDGEKELYDINKDPYELNNKARDANFFPIRAFLHSELIRLETCVGRTCQEAGAEIPADPRPAAQGRQGTAGKAERRETEGTAKQKQAPARR